MHPWLRAARDGLADAADPAAAEPMRAYMKSPMPFRGVPKPARERLLRTLVADHPIDDADELTTVADTLWTEATYREERYLAISLLGHKRYARWAEPGWVPMYRRWIVTGAWWDFTDEIAGRHIGSLLRAYRPELTPVLRGWIGDPDRWLRRTSVICQLSAKAETDLDLLRDAVEANLDDPDFFLRKGIGWALRQHARVDPDWVRAFVDEHPGLSPLSRREALKHLGE
ncbi:DNA alkylation repair protein [Pseudonocardia lacus]|uniref:DNA alkylation repair protein n=1 Tax=Pseudonocardia lacus TaxID=2835865 RepID=UPI001BDC2EAF|nr:DNA alkylation repair protein [Pseudonocardia lacus]